MIPVQWDHAKITDMIKFSTSENAFRVLWLVLSILVISSSTLIWPYMVNDCAELKMFSPKSEIFLWIKPKKKKKNFLVESLDRYRSTRKGKKCFFEMSLRLSDHKVVYTTSRLHQVFLDFARIFWLFLLVFRTSNIWSLRNLIKQLFHSRLLDIRLVIANLALRASLAIYHLLSKTRSWNN